MPLTTHFYKAIIKLRVIPSSLVFDYFLKRDRTTLHRLIIANVQPNTTIITDQWAAYQGLEELGLGYKVNGQLTIVLKLSLEIFSAFHSESQPELRVSC